MCISGLINGIIRYDGSSNELPIKKMTRKTSAQPSFFKKQARSRRHLKLFSFRITVFCMQLIRLSMIGLRPQNHWNLLSSIDSYGFGGGVRCASSPRTCGNHEIQLISIRKRECAIRLVKCKVCRNAIVLSCTSVESERVPGRVEAQQKTKQKEMKFIGFHWENLNQNKTGEM